MDKKINAKLTDIKNSMDNSADLVNRSQIGNLSQLTKGYLLTRIITSVIVCGIISLIFYALNT
ncbi:MULTISPECIES: hypothetical protein [Clostridium]|uniref:Uncharacterized protein n=1 Tax=Clostridium beijerinckii TaxID=1520 RepID=A0AAW3WFA7_CLOBE|nr:hypothetical protein [Clostridium beijerinckii]MBC2459601.1 hypothetical protein [Clostridium beijerinckii]MBC2477068.1 hypothetical protein [Clostridium beijerinckii]MCI1580904.1 hypothetical protein [Clostridium beijerinckii]MCI1584177.1 hypothetical protein [Clostridium beijerinckii]MCI1624256.1 hypothetical protein [Clostridium beijerinckii]